MSYAKNLYPELPQLNYHLAHNAPTMAECIPQSNSVQCYLHQSPILDLCRAAQCPQRLLCRVCKEEHATKHKQHIKWISSIAELIALDNPFIRELDLLSKEEDPTKEPRDPRFKLLSNSITSAFMELRIRGEELLNQAEEQAQAKARESFFLRKNTAEWANLRNDYLTFRNRYLSFLGTENNGLDNLVNVINTVLEKQAQREAEIEASLKFGKEQMDKFLQRLKENTTILADSLFQSHDNSSSKIPSIAIDPTKISYNSDLRANHKLLLNAMTYIPKLDQLVTASECGSLTTWNPSTYTPIATLKVHSDAINSLLYVEKESLLVTASKDKSVRLVPVDADGINIKKTEVFSSHTAPVRSLLLLEGEDRIASAGEDADLRIWHMKSRNLEMIISTKGWKTCGDEMAWIRPERWIAVAGKGEIRIYNYVSRELVMTQSVWKMTGSLAFLNEKRLLVARNDDDQITFWKLDSNKKKLKKEMKMKLESKTKKPVYFKCFEESNLLIASTGTEKIIAFDMANGQITRELSTKLQSPTCFTLLKSERKIAVGDAESNLIGFVQY